MLILRLRRPPAQKEATFRLYIWRLTLVWSTTVLWLGGVWILATEQIENPVALVLLLLFLWLGLPDPFPLFWSYRRFQRFMQEVQGARE